MPHVPTEGGTLDDVVDADSHRPLDGVVDRVVIDQAIDELPEEFRLAVVLRDLCDLDYAEIATTLDVPIGTVKSRIARGRSQLAARLGNHPRRDERPTTAPGEAHER